MDIIDIRYQLNKILSLDKINARATRKYEALLSKLEEVNDSRYLLYKAKFLHKTGEYEEARDYYVQMIDSLNHVFDAYYGLYCLAVKEKNYEDAYKYILLCKENDNNSNMDLNLQIAICKACIDLRKNPEEFFENDYIVELDNNKRNSDYYIAKLYDEVVSCFNKGNYAEAITILKKIRAVDKSVNSYFESKIIFKSMNDLLELESKAYLEYVNKNGFLTTTFKNGNVRQLLNCMRFAIIDEVDLVEKVFYENIGLIFSDTNLVAADYIEKRIIERRKYSELSEEDGQIYRNTIVKIREALKKDDYESVIKFAEKGKEITNLAMFDYYEAVGHLRSGNKLEAIFQFESYLDNGGIKSIKVRKYLAFLYTDIGEYEKAALMKEEITQLENYFVKLGRNRIYTGNGYNDNKVSTSENVSNNISSAVEKSMDEELSISEFYSYSFTQKMALIRKLYSTNLVKVADKLMKEVEKESNSSVEKKFISKEKQNKKLYITKGKFGYN